MSKIIVITGAGLGLGRALARRFVSEGHRVVLLGRTAAKVHAVAEELGDKALAIECNVGVPASVRDAFAELAKHHPKIDVLINNAAVYEPFLIAEATDEQIVEPIMTNVAGAILCVRSAIPLMGRGAHIINVSSESVETHFPHLILYQCTKAALERFTIGLARELEPSGIRVTAVRAGQMYEEGKTFNADPAALKRFHQAAVDAGMDPRKRPITHIKSATQIFSSLLDLPEDLHAVTVVLQARRSG